MAVVRLASLTNISRLLHEKYLFPYAELHTRTASVVSYTYVIVFNVINGVFRQRQMLFGRATF